MRPTEFDNTQIIEAGQRLVAAGRNITGFALRKEVGGGTPARLKQVWDEHVGSGSSGRSPEPLADLPMEVSEPLSLLQNELTERLTRMVTELNDKAVKAAERRVSDIVREAGEQRKAAERELADASLTVEDLENKLDTALDEAKLLQHRLLESERAQQQHQIELAQLRERLQSQDAALAKSEAERTEAKKQADDARDKIGNLTGQIEALEKMLRPG